MTGEGLLGDGADEAESADAELQKAPVLRHDAVGAGTKATKIDAPNTGIKLHLCVVTRSLGSDVDAHGRPPVGEADLVVHDGELDRSTSPPFGNADPAQVARTVPRVRIFAGVNHVGGVRCCHLTTPCQLELVIAAHSLRRQHDLDMQGREWHAFDDLLFAQKPPP